MYTAIVEPTIMYAASVWYRAARKQNAQKILNQVQRAFAQKISKSYRIVSLHSALILAGILPLDLRIQEAAKLYEAKRGIPDITIEIKTPYIVTHHIMSRIST